MKFNKTIREFDEFTSKYEVEFQGVNIWPYLRLYSLDKLHFGTDTMVKVDSKKAFTFLKFLLYGFRFWFKSFDAVVFMGSGNRLLYKGKWTEKTDFLPEYIGRTWFIELPIKGHYPGDQLPNPEVSSKLVLLLIEKLFAKLVVVPKHIYEIQNEVDQRFKMSSNMGVVYKQFVSRYWITRQLGKLKRFKTAIINAAYVDMPRVMALKKLGTKVIELQHGIINSDHHGYMIYNAFDPLLQPDDFLSFGTQEQSLFKSSEYIDSERVFPLGSFYLEHIKESSIKSEVFEKIRENHQVIISATGQTDCDDLLIAFLNQVLTLRPSWACVYIPRVDKEDYYRENFELNPAIFFADNLNVYEKMKLSDIHTTIYSTCAIESVAIGIPNVMYDHDNRATNYFGAILTNKESNAFCTSPEEFVQEVEKKLSLDVDRVVELNSHLFYPSFFKNLSSYFREKY
ncbi:MAG: hypothetical protein CL840_13035 [Crocinitomicaceae bacterium]|nr:hypothetical protein [Crocinitomicaceae bacterium]